MIVEHFVKIRVFSPDKDLNSRVVYDRSQDILEAELKNGILSIPLNKLDISESIHYDLTEFKMVVPDDGSYQFENFEVIGLGPLDYIFTGMLVKVEIIGGNIGHVKYKVIGMIRGKLKGIRTYQAPLIKSQK